MSQKPLGEALVGVFNRVFQAADATILCGGASEPYYEPGAPSVIYFREDFDRSALHEVAHWCVAGPLRGDYLTMDTGMHLMGAMLNSRARFTVLR